MAEVRALEKHPCPDCGGDAEWDAAKKALLCPYCGRHFAGLEELGITADGIPEYCVDAFLAETAQGQHGLGDAKRSVKCESCHAISIFDPEHAAQRCDFCGSPAIIPADEFQELITPESLLPAIISEQEVRTRLRKWYGSRWFAPRKLRRLALTDTVHGIYIPYWTFDANAEATWTAQSGYYYYVTQTYRAANGRQATRRVRKTRWVPSSGNLTHSFDDELVSGTVGVTRSLLNAVEPFPTIGHLKSYDPAFVRGWTVERYQVDLRKAAEENIRRMDDFLRTLCAAQVPGDTHRALVVSATYQDRRFKHILVPLWLTTYTYGKRSFQVIVNGYTGKIAGKYPLSWVKITLLVLGIVLLLSLVLSMLVLEQT